MRMLVETAGVGPGGVSRFVTQTLRAWPEQDEIAVLTTQESLAADLPSRVETTVLAHGGRVRTIASVGAATVMLTRAWRPDVILTPSPTLQLPTWSPARRVVVLHDVFFRLVPATLSPGQRIYRSAVYRQALRRADAVVAVSERTRHDLAGWLPDVAARTSVVHQAAAEVFHGGADGWSPDPDDPYLVAPSHNTLKGSDLIMAAARRGLPMPVTLLAGSPQRRARLQAEVDRHQLSGSVRVLGHVSDAELHVLLSRSRGLLMASDVEGFGLPALEALAGGVPVVVSPDPALREATGGYAITMTEWSPPALRRAVEQLDATPVEHWHAARRWASRRDWTAVAADLRAIVSGTLNPTAGAGLP